MSRQLSLTNLKRTKRLHVEELGGPQLKVEAEAVEESPHQHHLAGSQPQDGDAEGAQRCHQLLHHILVFSTQIIVHVPVDNETAPEPLNMSRSGGLKLLQLETKKRNLVSFRDIMSCHNIYMYYYRFKMNMYLFYCKSPRFFFK